MATPKRKRENEEENVSAEANGEAAGVALPYNISMATLARIEAQMSMLQNEVVLQRQQNAEMKAQVSLLQTEVSTQRHQTAQISLLQSEVTTQRHNIAVLKAELDCLKSSPRQHGVPEVPVASNVQPIKLRNGNNTESINNLSDKGLSLSSAITQLSVGGHLKNLDQFASIPSIPSTIISFTNRSKLKHCLALVDFSGEPDDIAILKGGKEEDRVRVDDAAARLTAASLAKMLELEGSSSAVAEASGGHAPRGSVLGLCKRISLYRNLVKEVTNDTRGIGKVPLIEYWEYRALLEA